MTSMINLPKGVWTEVSTTAVYFQVPSQQDVFAIEAATEPENGDTSIIKKINPGEMYTFNPVDGILYLYAEDYDCKVAIDPA